jgi:uncharacterized phiE125 gp8 family phage protein
MFKKTNVSATENVTLSELKEHLNYSGSLHDNVLPIYISAAREYCENYMNRALITQTITLLKTNWPDNNKFMLPFYGSTSITKVEYLLNNTWIELATTEYRKETDSVPVMVVLKASKFWPLIDDVPGNIRITYTVTVSAIDKDMKEIILLLAAEMFANRENPARTYTSLAEKLMSLKRINYYE